MDAGLSALFLQVPAAFLLFARITGMLVAAPVLGGSYVPLRVRILLSLAITLLVAPVVLPAAGGVATLWYPLALAKELATGLLLGFVVDCFFQAVLFGGDMIGRIAGFAAAETFNPLFETTSGPTGQLFHLPLVLLYLGCDGHHHLLMALARSFELVPLGAAGFGNDTLQVTVAATQAVFDLGLALAFPLLAAVMAITVAEGVVARAVPQINILHISFGVKILGTLIVLFFGVPAAVAFFGVILTAAQQAVLDLVPTLA